MDKPLIALLNSEEREQLLSHVSSTPLSQKDKKTITEWLSFYDELITMLKLECLSIDKLKQALLEQEDKRKKAMQLR